MRRLGLVLLTAALLPLSAFAQTSKSTAWITWRAATYVPPAYEGRALAIPGSSIVAALDVISNGRPADLSRETIYWYLNDEYLDGGVGKTRITFNSPGRVGGGTITLRVSLPNYEDGLARTIRIPVVSPEAVIQNVPFGGIFSSLNLKLKAAPYYFNIQDPNELNSTWKINGKEPSAYNDPFSLEINLDSSSKSQFSFPINLRLENPRGSFEVASEDISLTFKPQ